MNYVLLNVTTYTQYFRIFVAESIERVKELDHVLTSGRYVGIPNKENDFDFNERFTKLKSQFQVHLKAK